VKGHPWLSAWLAMIVTGIAYQKIVVEPIARDKGIDSTDVDALLAGGMGPTVIGGLAPSLIVAYLVYKGTK
jgi:hypothetical protein